MDNSVEQFLSLGVTASIGIALGSVLSLISCVTALGCLCRKLTRHASKQQRSPHRTTVSSAPSPAARMSGHAETQIVFTPPRAYYSPAAYEPNSRYTAEYGVESRFSAQTASTAVPSSSHHRSITPTSSKSGGSSHRHQHNRRRVATRFLGPTGEPWVQPTPANHPWAPPTAAQQNGNNRVANTNKTVIDSNDRRARILPDRGDTANLHNDSKLIGGGQGAANGHRTAHGISNGNAAIERWREQAVL